MMKSLQVMLSSTILLLIGKFHALAFSNAFLPQNIKPQTLFSSSSKEAEQLFHSHYQKHEIPSNTAILTYLKINGWLLTSNGVTILIDPILEGPLDFGIPSVYSASKRVLPSFGLCKALPPNVDCLLITQGLDDHAHAGTLNILSDLYGDKGISIIAPPSARPAIERSGFSGSVSNDIRYVSPGQSNVAIRPRVTTSTQSSRAAAGLALDVTSGARVGPPWQARENGYIIRGIDSNDRNSSSSSSSTCPSIYIEPHVEFNENALRMYREKFGGVDAVITPILGQGLPVLDLVHGPNDALRLIDSLRPKYVLPMGNGDVDAQGPLSSLVNTIGSPGDFQRVLASEDWGKGVEVVNVVPGEDIRITI